MSLKWDSNPEVLTTGVWVISALRNSPCHSPWGDSLLLLLLLFKCYDLAQSLIAKASGFWQVCSFVIFLGLLCQWLYPSVRDGIEVNYIPTLSKRAIQKNGGWNYTVPDAEFLKALWFFYMCFPVCFAHCNNFIWTAAFRDFLAQSSRFGRFGWLRKTRISEAKASYTHMLKINIWSTVFHW